MSRHQIWGVSIQFHPCNPVFLTKKKLFYSALLKLFIPDYVYVGWLRQYTDVRTQGTCDGQPGYCPFKTEEYWDNFNQPSWFSRVTLTQYNKLRLLKSRISSVSTDYIFKCQFNLGDPKTKINWTLLLLFSRITKIKILRINAIFFVYFLHIKLIQSLLLIKRSSFKWSSSQHQLLSLFSSLD